MPFDVALAVGEDEPKLAVFFRAFQFPFAQGVYDHRGQGDRPLAGIRLRWPDFIEAIGTLAEREVWRFSNQRRPTASRAAHSPEGR